MKQKLFMSVFILLSINSFAQGEFPNKKQFAVKCEDGTVSELDTDIKNVYENLVNRYAKKTYGQFTRKPVVLFT